MRSNETVSRDSTADRAAIADILRTFFAAFTSGPGSVARLDALRSVFLPDAVIVRTCVVEPVVYGVDSFINPRQALLSGGTLVDFSEWELLGHTQVFGDIAQHFCSYAKTGVQDGTRFTSRGMKTLQFVRTADGWRISAVAWDDEREGLTIEPPICPCALGSRLTTSPISSVAGGMPVVAMGGRPGSVI